MSQTQYQSVVLADTPNLFYPLTEASGTTFGDVSGNNITATATGSPTVHGAGPFTGAFSVAFNGSSQYISIPHVSVGGTFSVEAWVKTSTSTTQSVFGNQSAANSGFVTAVTSTAVQFQTNAAAFSNYGTLTSGVWHHVVWSFNAGTLTCYVDSVATGVTGTGLSFAGNSTGALYIGADLQSGGNLFNGSISNVSIWVSKALTAAQVLNHYNAALPAFPTVVDSAVYLTNNGVTLGSNKASGTAWASAGVRTYGASADTWGATLTPTIVNSPTFGFDLTQSVTKQTGTGTFTWNPSLTVYYTLPNPTVVESATTVGVTNLTGTSVTLVGSVQPNTTGAYWFRWGPTTQMLNITPSAFASAMPGPGGVLSPQLATANLTGLTTGQQYYFEVIMQDSATTIAGIPMSFVAQNAAMATVQTLSPIDVPHIQFPVTLTDEGLRVVDQDSDEDIISGVITVMACDPGEFPEVPTFGIPDLTFSQGPITAAQLQAAIQQWEPRATLDVLSTIVDSTGGEWTLNTDIVPQSGALPSAPFQGTPLVANNASSGSISIFDGGSASVQGAFILDGGKSNTSYLILYSGGNS